MTDHDVVVVGAGSAGLVAARTARRLDLRVAIVERARFGGDCTWTGCVPSKALVAAGRAAHAARRASRFGLPTYDDPIDLEAVWDHIRRSRHTIAAEEDADALSGESIEVLTGRAHLDAPDRVRVGSVTLRTRHVLLATGSRPAPATIDGLEQADVRTTDDLWDRPPPTGPVLVLGAGPVGLELAQGLGRLGLEVTVVEPLERALGSDDADHAAMLTAAIEREGVRIRTGKRLTRVESGSQGSRCTLEARAGATDALDVETIILVAGRIPNIEGLGLTELGIRHGAAGIEVDERLRTSSPTVYAAGDVTGRYQYTHAAGYEGAIAIRNMFLPGFSRARAVMPWCTFTDPELAGVGSTEAEARARHRRGVRVRRTAREREDRAVTDEVDTFDVKIVERRNKILGASVIGPSAGELVNELALAIGHGMRTDALGHTVHAYPTWGTALFEIGGESLFEKAARVPRFLLRRA